MSKSRQCLRAILAAVLAAVLLAASLTQPPAARADDPVLDPIPENPIASGLGLTLEEVAQFPKSEPWTGPVVDPRLRRWARINYLGEVPDGSGRMYVPDLNGKMHLLQKGTPREYLDVGATFSHAFFNNRGLGQGFGFVTFHPEFKRNGKFYTIHTEDAAKATTPPDLPAQPNSLFHGVITEWTAADPSASTFSGKRREMLRLGFGGQVHGIQQIDFNPTAHRSDRDYGLLYVAAGDGGRGNANTDPQNMAMPHGKILRIDPAGTNGANGRYGIPRGNPFVGKPGALGEIYALGMRDPHRFSWDPRAGNRMFLGHIGEHAIEGVYEVRPGSNFGWSEREGAFTFTKTPTNPCHRLFPLPADDERYGYSYPVAAYDHDPPATWDCKSDVGKAIAGGFVYRGHRIPALYGKYVFGDIVDGRIFYTNADEMRTGRKRARLFELMVYDKAGRRTTMKDLAGDARVDFRLGADASGELYVIAKANGKIWKVTGTRAFARCRTGHTQVSDAMGAENWSPVTPSKWQFPGHAVILAEAGEPRPGPRRPFEYAVLKKGPGFGSARIDATVRLDTPVNITNRDVIIVFGYRADTEFYYAHLSTDNTIYPHNGIFKVNNADRLRLDDQWDAVRSRGAAPAITDMKWHKVRVTRCAESGETAVYVDGSRYPLMTAVDTTFNSGRVGFGSFDNIGRLRDLKVTGAEAAR